MINKDKNKEKKYLMHSKDSTISSEFPIAKPMGVSISVRTAVVFTPRELPEVISGQFRQCLGFSLTCFGQISCTLHYSATLIKLGTVSEF